MEILREEKGFTLIEVIVAIVIIGIVLISYSPLFFHSNKISTYNNEKLVVINLANAELERLKLTPEEDIFGTGINKFTKPGSTFINYKEKTITKNAIINATTYEVKVTANQQREEHDAKLLNIRVQVIGSNSNLKSMVEGYLSYE